MLQCATIPRLLAALVLLAVLALCQAGPLTSLTAHSDTSGIEDFCPFAGNLKKIRYVSFYCSIGQTRYCPLSTAFDLVLALQSLPPFVSHTILSSPHPHSQYANRLLYEGKISLARACYAKALNLAFDPEGVMSEDADYPLPSFDEQDLFRRSKHLKPNVRRHNHRYLTARGFISPRNFIYHSICFLFDAHTDGLPTHSIF